MANLFNQDFQDFIQSLKVNEVEYILVGGYAVILHGYIRSTADMDVWVHKTKDNYKKFCVGVTKKFHQHKPTYRHCCVLCGWFCSFAITNNQ